MSPEDHALAEHMLVARGLPAAAAALARPHLSLRVLRPGEALTRAGRPATHAALVLEGVMREHFLVDEGREVTKGFAVEGELTGSLRDLLSDGPSRVYVVAETDARLAVIAFSDVEALVAASPDWQQALHRLERRLHLQKEERELELLSCDARERYRRFRARYPGLEARVTQRAVASYLGITPVHLSRLRSQGR